MTLKEMRKALADQIKLVKSSADNIPQAETIANLAGKTIKAIQLEMQAELMREKGEKLNILLDILEPKK
jgi:hypothetical protein